MQGSPDLKLVEMGYLKSPHGVRGALKLRLYNPDPKSILFQASQKTPLEIYLNKHDRWIHLESLSLANSELAIATFSEIKSMDEAKALLPSSFSIKRSLLGNEIYLADLQGLKVIEKETGTIWGTVDSTYSNGAQEVLVLKSLDGTQSVELPYVNIFFPSLDMEKGEILCSFPEEI